MLTLPTGVELELLQQDGRYRGVGAVRAAGVPLRSTARPWLPAIRSPYGMAVDGFRLLAQDPLPDGGARLTLAVTARVGGPMEWGVHECRLFLNTVDWSDEPAEHPDARLTLDFTPVRRRVGGTDYVGLRYQYRFRCADYPVYFILDQSTWEPGGRLVGQTVLQRSCFAPSRFYCEDAKQAYSSEWRIGDCLNPNAFQFLPLQTELQGFTFTAGPSGTLITWCPEPAHVRTLLEKPAGADLLVHRHELAGDLAADFPAPPMEVLFAPDAPRDEADLANAHHDFFEYAADTLHAAAGLRRERIRPHAYLEEWTEPDFEAYRTRALPELLRAGARTVYVANHFRNNMNTFGLSNMCCTLDHRVADAVGADALKRFADDVRADGASVEMWGNWAVSGLLHFLCKPNGRARNLPSWPSAGSTGEVVFGKARDPFVRNSFGQLECDHYTPDLITLNLRDPDVFAHLRDAWVRLHDEQGIEGIFNDSSFNMSSDKFHFRFNPAADRVGATADQTDLTGGGAGRLPGPVGRIESQYFAHLALVRALQEAGIHYGNEDLGVFGTHRHGPDLLRRLDNLHLWADCIVNFDPPALRAAGHEPDDVFFRGLAYRQMWELSWDFDAGRVSWRPNGGPGDEFHPTSRQLAWLRTYGRIEDLLRNRHVLPDEAGVVYRPNADTAVLWPFRDQPFMPWNDAAAVRLEVDGVEEAVDGWARTNRIHLFRRT